MPHRRTLGLFGEHGTTPYPDGLDAEVMTRAALSIVAREASSAYDRERVTSFLHTRSQRFRLGGVENATDQRHMRWTVDIEADLRMVKAVFAALLPLGEFFDWKDVVALPARRPDIAKLNAA